MESVNKTFTLIDNYFLHMVRKTDIFDIVREAWKFIG